jgi:hypothetical protein
MRVDRAAHFMRSFVDSVDFSPSVTLFGLPNQLYSNHISRPHSVSDSILVKQDVFRDVGEQMKINARRPNQYLWPYTDRFIDTPMFSSRFLLQTDMVPFLQLVLNGTMEMYSPYVNFSFYTDRDILRIIDFNVSPSFLITQLPSYHLAQTNSSDFFSTEFIQFEELIHSVYEQVNEALRHVIGADWVNREILENGAVVNSYSNGVSIIINYTNDRVIVNGVTVEPLSAKVVY